MQMQKSLDFFANLCKIVNYGTISKKSNFTRFREKNGLFSGPKTIWENHPR